MKEKPRPLGTWKPRRSWCPKNNCFNGLGHLAQKARFKAGFLVSGPGLRRFDLICQRWRHHAHHRIASKPAPTNLRRPQNPGIPRYPVGAGLPAMASSRPPPHRQQAGSYKFEASTKSWNTSTPCRSWLEQRWRHHAHHRIASKPAPTDWGRTQNSETPYPAGAGLLAMASSHSPSLYRQADHSTAEFNIRARECLWGGSCNPADAGRRRREWFRP